jgi:hypothetical protein
MNHPIKEIIKQSDACIEYNYRFEWNITKGLCICENNNEVLEK